MGALYDLFYTSKQTHEPEKFDPYLLVKTPTKTLPHREGFPWMKRNAFQLLKCLHIVAYAMEYTKPVHLVSSIGRR
jgi:hypothetical protein